MYRIALLTLALFINCLLTGQDAYHTSLVSFLETNHNLQNPTYPIANTESGIKNAITSYGNISRVEKSVSDQDFTQSTTITVNVAGQNQWDAGYNAGVPSAIGTNDLLIMTFWARAISATANMYVQIEHTTTFDKEVYTLFDLTSEWQQYWYPAKASQGYSAGQLQIGFHLATQVQEIEIGGLTLLNYGNSYPLSQAPNNNDNLGYGGDDPNDPWRAEAASRIEQLRKADLNLTIQDVDGNPIPNATVVIAQTKHDFGFGSAIVPSRFPGNRNPNATYVDKLTNLDGQGHGFNEVVTENALKWDGWEEEWIGTPSQTVSAIQSLTDMGIKVRGHVLIWPGWEQMPDDINQNKDNIPYVKNRILDRVDEMLLHPQLKDLVTDWDVINEITFVRDLENHLKGKSGYTTGREIYKEILDRAAATAPNTTRYMNDYAVITQGAKDGLQNQRFISFLDELFEVNAPIDGIGFQSHVPSPLPSILDVKARLDQYTARYNVPIKITEYDTNVGIGDQLAGDYMADFLTMVFSHENVEAFIMWGFWDGNHWKSNAPLFDMDWNLKPAGERFNQLVFGDWWTEETTTSDASGVVDFRPFKGSHQIMVSVDGKSYTTDIELTEDMTTTITADFTSAVYSISDSPFRVYPNPVTDHIHIDLPLEVSRATLIVYDLLGRPLRSEQISEDVNLPINLPNGQYLLKIQTDQNAFSDIITILNNY